MTWTPGDACPTCDDRAADHHHVLRCAHTSDCMARAGELAVAAGASALDGITLWGHLRGTDDPERALHAVRTALELGWRPT